MNTRDLYLDKYIPLQTAVLISDYLHNCVDNSTKEKTGGLREYRSEGIEYESA